jgi:alpha-1,2-mannosyltransferase
LSPPFFIFCMGIITQYISYQNLFLGYIFVSISLNIIALIKLYQHFFKDKENIFFCLSFILANFFYFPSCINITFGQVGLILNALTIFTYLSLKKEKNISAGFYIAIAINIKLFFGLFFIYFFARKNYRALFSLITFTSIFGIIPILLYGFSIYKNYFDVLNNIQWYGTNWNASWYGFLSRILGEPSHRFSSFLYYPKIAKISYYFIFFVYLIFIYYFSKKINSISLTFSFIISSMLIISPLGWGYYFPLLITPLLINLKLAQSHKNYHYYFPLMLMLLFISSLPIPLYYKNYTPIKFMTYSNILFLSLFLFNIITLLLSRNKKNSLNTQELSNNIKLLLIFIFLLPSFLGAKSIINTFTQDKYIEAPYSQLATEQDLLPSK